MDGLKLTCVIVVIVGHPEHYSEELEYVEWMKDFLHKQPVVWLHWDINGVWSIMQ